MPFSANSSSPAESQIDTNMSVAVKPLLTAMRAAKSHSGFSRVKAAARQHSCCRIKTWFKQCTPLMGKKKKGAMLSHPTTKWRSMMWFAMHSHLFVWKAWSFLLPITLPITLCSQVLLGHLLSAHTATSQALQSTAGILLLPQILSKYLQSEILTSCFI